MSIPGKTVDSTEVNTRTIKSTATASTHGPMAEHIQVIGAAVNNTVSVLISFQASKQRAVSGRKASV